MSCCCEYVDKKICKSMKDPLEEKYEDIFLPLEDDQKEIIDTGGIDLILIENASGIFSNIKDNTRIFEDTLKKIFEDNKIDPGKIFSESKEFPYVMKPESFEKYKKNQKDKYHKYNKKQKKTKDYDKLIAKYKEEVGREKNFILHFAVLLGDLGAHYGTVIKKDRDVMVFDSMQRNGESFYTSFFAQVARDVFGIEPEIVSSSFSLQITGGFPEPSENKEEHFRNMRDMDSQNHFCYFWSIWYIHLFLTKGRNGIIETFHELEERKIHPLIVIKKYIWSCLFHVYPDTRGVFEDTFKLSKKDITYLLGFFVRYFRSVYDDLGTGVFQRYRIIDCDIDQFRNASSIDYCLEYSLKETPYIVDEDCL